MGTSIVGLTSLILGLFSIFFTATVFVVTMGSSLARYRSVFGRICVQLSVDHTHETFLSKHKEHKALFWPETRSLTALEFMRIGDQRSHIIDCIEEVAPSLFGVRLIVLSFGSHVLAGLFAPLITGAAFLLFPRLHWFDPAKHAVASWESVVMVSTIAGVCISAVGSAIILRIAFVRNRTWLRKMVENDLLWGPGVNSGPADRPLLLGGKDETLKDL